MPEILVGGNTNLQADAARGIRTRGAYEMTAKSMRRYSLGLVLSLRKGWGRYSVTLHRYPHGDLRFDGY